MARVRSRDTGPELRLRRAAWRRGLRYRLGYRLPGKPDLTFIGPRVVVFVDGCFWHMCPEHASLPKQNARFWREKLEGNRDRDRHVTARLEAEGWTVLRFWEHDIERDLPGVVDAIERGVRERSGHG